LTVQNPFNAASAATFCRRLQNVRMPTSLSSWLDGLSPVQLALVCCLFFIAITLIGIVLIHPLMRRLIHGERQANDVVIFVAANYGLIFAVLLGLLTVATFQTTKDLQHPSPRIRAMLEACALNLLAVDGSAIDALVAAKPYFTKGRISGGQYGLNADVPSFGVTAILMTTASMDSRVVVEFAKSLTSQIDALKKRHPVLESLSAQAMPPDKLPARLHPAAGRAYAELGAAK
jgi:NMT1-like family